jgi:acyl dehydratase
MASGWHAGAIFMRMVADGFLLDTTSLGSPGIDKLRWLRPLRPGTDVTGRSTVLETRASKSRPEMGTVRFHHDLFEAGGETLLWMENSILFGRRETR